MKRVSKKLLALLLAAAMVFGLSGMTAFAAEADEADAAIQTLALTPDNWLERVESGEQPYEGFSHGALTISGATDNETYNIAEGEAVVLTVTPYAHVQYPGCTRGDKCNEDTCGRHGVGWVEGKGCPCTGTEDSLRLANVTVKTDQDGIISVAEDCDYSDLSTAGDMKSGTVTLTGLSAGTVKVTVTAALYDWEDATTTFTIVVGGGDNEPEESDATVNYAVKIWGINADTFSYDGGETMQTAGLTFGPALGGIYITGYKSCDSEYCIHNMTWDEIIAQSMDDPTVFESCKENGCTKAVPLTPNDTIFNMTTVENAVARDYDGDGVTTLFYLLNGVGSQDPDKSYGAVWNASTDGYSAEDPANVYSRSRIRTTLTGDKSNIDAWLTLHPDANDYYEYDTLCDESNCLFSCLPKELQKAAVPRTTVNTGNATRGTYRGYDTTTTYDKLFMFSLSEIGVTNTGDDSGGTDYGVNKSSWTAYEFSGTGATGSTHQRWWMRSRYGNNNYQAFYMGFSSTEGAQWVHNADYGGLSFGFCLPGPGAILPVDKSDLQAEYDADSTLKEEDYTPGSWKPFAEALAKAGEVLEDEDATQTEVNDALDALKTAKANLAEPADKSKLQAEYDADSTLKEEDYTPGSWKPFAEALTKAGEVLEDKDATQTEVDDALDELKTAKDNLAEPTDKTDLEKAITDAEALNPEDYTEESWSAVGAACQAAQDVMDDPNATQDAIDKATLELVTAIAGLEKVEPTGETVDKSALLAEYTEDTGMVDSSYTSDSWKAFADALDAAQSVLTNPDATQDDVDSALKALQDAKANLTKAADKTELEKAIADAEALDPAEFTEESWSDVDAALQAAQDVMDDSNATQDAADKATVELVTALAGLEKVEPTGETVDKSALLAEYTEDMGMDDSAYTSDSWQVFADALDAAQSVLTNPDATQDDVDSALKVLQDAKANLTKAADKTELEKAIADAEALDPTEFTEESWSDVDAALQAAQDVMDDSNATQDAVDKATVDLVTAIAGLDKVDESGEEVDKSDLLAEYTEDMGMDDSAYTSDSWQVFADALDAAQSVLTNPDATQDDVDSALKALQDAKANLVTLEKEALEDEIKAAEALNESPYTPDSWADLQKALTNAKAVLNDSDATEDEIAAAENALKTAMDNLELKNGLYMITAGKEWGYYKDGKVDTSYTGFASNQNGDWYVVNGYIHFDQNTVAKDTTGKNGDKGVSEKGTWWYVIGNKVQRDFIGLANYKNENGWWYIVDGKVDFTHNGVDKNKNGWWYVTGGKVQFGFTGLAHYKNQNGWWYIKDGKVNFTHTGVDKNQNGWWYVTGGKVDFTHNGVDKNQYGWWYITGGKVQFGFTGLAHYKNQNGWWYINAGKVDFTHSGVDKNQNGWWYVTGGKVDFSYNGRASNQYGTWNIVNGKVKF